jgi:hypothetical protein
MKYRVWNSYANAALSFHLGSRQLAFYRSRKKAGWFEHLDLRLRERFSFNPPAFRGQFDQIGFAANLVSWHVNTMGFKFYKEALL